MFGNARLHLLKKYIVSAVLLNICAMVCVDVQAGVNNDKWSNDIRRGAKFWIGETGPTGPVFTGPHQYPFICTTNENGLGQPLIDNQLGIGNAVFPEVNGVPDFTADPVGYSRLCNLPTRVDYFYFSTTYNNFLPLADPGNIPTDVEQIIIDDETVNFVVRLERGTINRFIYGIAMLAPYAESLHNPKTLNNDAWNGKLVYKFQGGVGIGHQQGSFSLSSSQALHYASLKRGYAVAYSTGTKTSTHYNLNLVEETALMVKAHFRATYGKPKYTVGIGGSGGGIAQYVVGQNNPHVIDAAIAQLAYSDMITQTIHIADCELLERYFDFEYLLDDTSRWANWLERGLIEGLSTSTIAFVDPWSLSPYAPAPGSSTCINGWRGLVQKVANPAWADQDYFQALALYRYPPEVIAGIKWTHWNDLGNIYPQDENGLAPNTIDNVGVQYGLHALRTGAITPQEFLDLNACVGGWKSPQDMVLGYYPWDPNADPATFDPWDQRNMNLSPLCKFGLPAPRTEGSVAAMNTAYNSGHVFQGELDIPVFDIRFYLEPILDMHHSHESFAARARMIEAKGHADNQVIWFLACDLDPIYLNEQCSYDPTGDVLEILDDWLAKSNGKSSQQVIKRKPAAAMDACFSEDGTLLYSGPDAWDGIINDKPKGPCAMAFPIYTTSRIQAGGDIKGDIFKCALKPVAEALADGTYSNVEFTDEQKLLLNSIFPTGVCDYSKGDAGKPVRPPGKYK
ncbi:DUF6351 family protein [Kaarinaea lacus]